MVCLQRMLFASGCLLCSKSREGDTRGPGFPLSTPSSCAHQAEQAAAVNLWALRFCIGTQSRQQSDSCAGLPSSLINQDGTNTSTSREIIGGQRFVAAVFALACVAPTKRCPPKTRALCS